MRIILKAQNGRFNTCLLHKNHRSCNMSATTGSPWNRSWHAETGKWDKLRLEIGGIDPFSYEFPGTQKTDCLADSLDIVERLLAHTLGWV